jgi:HD-GYP domain-containing protein (c-di-GMP phosphodiesterase class II)
MTGTHKNNESHIESAVYTEHLAEVNKSRSVIAKDDIFNDRGVLLVKKGNPITPEITQAIMQFKLLKPIQDSITIKNEIGGVELYETTLKIIEGEASLIAIHKRYALDALLKSQFLSYDQFPMLRQKLTVMAERLPEIYRRTLCCTWLSVLIAKEMRLAAEEIANVFLAGLAHDIGMLHISPEILERQGQLSPEEWRQMQAHVVISKTILEALDNVPKKVCVAVLEHHERCDGTGYPTGKVESELSIIGQIIALSDSVIAVYFNKFKADGRNWRDVIPIIQMNSHAYFYRNYEVLVTILRRSELPSVNIVGQDAMPAFIDRLVEKNLQLKIWFDAVGKYLRALGFTHGDRKLHVLQNIYIHVATAVTGSGLLQDDFGAWLLQVKNEKLKDHYREIEDISLMQEEVVFHLSRLSKMTKIYLDANPKCSKTVIDALMLCLEQSVIYQAA